jgi:hypothetical protein
MVKNQFQYRRVALFLWLALWPLVLVAAVFPIRFASLRLCLVTGIVVLWAGFLYLFWNQKVVRAACIVPVLLSGVFLLLPGHRTESSSLRREYVAALHSYEGTPYVWGGESQIGIDCSGLPRCALIKANFLRGVSTANPAPIRESIGLWWYDSSAKALMEGYRARTRVLFKSRSINELDHARLLPGDFAVTSGGAHALAYVGNETWIEADPGPARRVILLKVPSNSAWLKTPVYIMRWRQLEPGP